jgi:hypothetical protein
MSVCDDLDGIDEPTPSKNQLPSTKTIQTTVSHKLSSTLTQRARLTKNRLDEKDLQAVVNATV